MFCFYYLRIKNYKNQNAEPIQASVAESVDAMASKALDFDSRAGSSPATRITTYSTHNQFKSLLLLYAYTWDRECLH